MPPHCCLRGITRRWMLCEFWFESLHEYDFCLMPCDAYANEFSQMHFLEEAAEFGCWIDDFIWSFSSFLSYWCPLPVFFPSHHLISHSHHFHSSIFYFFVRAPTSSSFSSFPFLSICLFPLLLLFSFCHFQEETLAPVTSDPQSLSVSMSSAGGAGSGSDEEGTSKPQPKRLHVSNIPFRFRDPDLRQMFGVRLSQYQYHNVFHSCCLYWWTHWVKYNLILTIAAIWQDPGCRDHLQWEGIKGV